MAGTALSVFASLFWVVDIATFGGGLTRIYAASLSLLAGLFVMSVLVRAIVRERRQGSFDYQWRLATQIASMVNEALVDVAERENWSYLRLETTKLRLSAFPQSDGRHRIAE